MVINNVGNIIIISCSNYINCIKNQPYQLHSLCLLCFTVRFEQPNRLCIVPASIIGQFVLMHSYIVEFEY